MRKYEPSNGTEGMWFVDKFCSVCEKDRKYRETDNNIYCCDILNRTFLYDLKDDNYPSEWICEDDHSKAKCTAFHPELTTADQQIKRNIENRKKLEAAGQLRLFRR